MKKHIVHIITSLGQGGAEKQLLNIANGLVKKDNKITIISLKNQAAVDGFNCEVKYFNFNKGYKFLWEFIKLVRYLSIIKPDVIQTWLYHSDLVGFFAGKIYGCKQIFWNIRCSDMNLKMYSPATKIVVSALAKLSKYVNGIVANSQAGIDFHRSIGYCNEHWHLIPNGFDIEKYNACNKNEIINFGMVARVDPMKDYQIFINAAKLIHKLHPNTKFFCVGTGTQIFTNDDYNIIGTGPVKNISEIYNQLDVFVLMSLSEGFPNVVGEAMAFGLPCIVTDVGDAKKLMGNNGVVIEPGNQQELITAMSGYIKLSNDERQKIGVASRQHIIDNYSLNKAVNLYDKLYSGA